MSNNTLPTTPAASTRQPAAAPLDDVTLLALECGESTCGRGFLPRTLLEAEGLPIADLAHLACKDGQASTPIYRVHRCFARRLGTEFRGILTGLTLGEDQGGVFWPTFEGRLTLQDRVVLDPFGGGGTSVVEASRCGARVIGYDIDPVAAEIFDAEGIVEGVLAQPGVENPCGSILRTSPPEPRLRYVDGSLTHVRFRGVHFVTSPVLDAGEYFIDATALEDL